MKKFKSVMRNKVASLNVTLDPVAQYDQNPIYKSYMTEEEKPAVEVKRFVTLKNVVFTSKNSVEKKQICSCL